MSAITPGNSFLLEARALTHSRKHRKFKLPDGETVLFTPMTVTAPAAHKPAPLAAKPTIGKKKPQYFIGKDESGETLAFMPMKVICSHPQ